MNNNNNKNGKHSDRKNSEVSIISTTLLMYAKREDIFKMQNGRHMSKSRSGKDLLQKNNYNKGTQTKVVTKV